MDSNDYLDMIDNRYLLNDGLVLITTTETVPGATIKRTIGPVASVIDSEDNYDNAISSMKRKLAQDSIKKGANAIIGCHFQISETDWGADYGYGGGRRMLLAFGTAVVIESEKETSEKIQLQRDTILQREKIQEVLAKNEIRKRLTIYGDSNLELWKLLLTYPSPDYNDLLVLRSQKDLRFFYYSEDFSRYLRALSDIDRESALDLAYSIAKHLPEYDKYGHKADNTSIFKSIIDAGMFDAERIIRLLSKGRIDAACTTLKAFIMTAFLQNDYNPDNYQAMKSVSDAFHRFIDPKLEDIAVCLTQIKSKLKSKNRTYDKYMNMNWRKKENNKEKMDQLSKDIRNYEDELKKLEDKQESFKNYKQTLEEYNENLAILAPLFAPSK